MTRGNFPAGQMHNSLILYTLHLTATDKTESSYDISKKKEQKKQLMLPFLYLRSESNRDQRNRNPLFYPLNYGGIPLGIAKIVLFL